MFSIIKIPDIESCEPSFEYDNFNPFDSSPFIYDILLRIASEAYPIVVEMLNVSPLLPLWKIMQFKHGIVILSFTGIVNCFTHRKEKYYG